MTNREQATAALIEWARIDHDRDNRVRAARAAGLDKMEIHRLTGIGRPTIDRILASGETREPLKWRRYNDSSRRYSYADDETKRYYVERLHDGWRVSAVSLTTTAGVKHAVNGRKWFESGGHDLKALAVAIAEAHSALGDDYRPHEHGHAERLTTAIQRAYDADKARQSQGVAR